MRLALLQVVLTYDPIALGMPAQLADLIVLFGSLYTVERHILSR